MSLRATLKLEAEAGIVMDAARWEQIKELYHAALERPADERAAFLATACAGDEELRREAAALLAAHAAAPDFALTE